MRNFIKYPPFRWRSTDEYYTPAGPSFESAPTTKIKLGGNTLKFKAPRHCPTDSRYEQFKYKALFNQLPCDPIRNGDGPTNGWEFCSPIVRHWGFYGPYGIGEAGNVSLAISVLTKENNCPSLFQPRAFENMLFDYLHTILERDDDHKGIEIAPVNWQPICFKDSFAATFDIAPFNSYNRIRKVFTFPLTKKHFLEIGFRVGQSVETSIDSNGSAKYAPANDHSNFNNQPMLDLIENVINSVELEYSEENLAEIEKVKKENPDLKMQLQETFLPLKLD